MFLESVEIDGQAVPRFRYVGHEHATGTCCRGCLEKWHGIPKGYALTTEEKAYILSVLRRWLIVQGGA
jgi:hypothetical protein